jgi:RimJ/RimL family protein N-acetyltransferase
VTVSIRRARADDVDFLLDLVLHSDVEPFVGAVSAKDRPAVEAEVERSTSEPHDFGRFVIEIDGRRAGAMGFELANRRSRVAHLERLAVHPSFRGRRIADEAARRFQLHLVRDLGYHRLQLEIYGFNERAVAHAERAGFVREGVRRRAYWRHGQWTDAVLFGLVADELGLPANILLLHDFLRAHNEAVRTGVWDSYGAWFAEDAELSLAGLEPGSSDEVVTFAVQEADGAVSADYGWRREPSVVAGRLQLRSGDGRKIAALVVSGS